MFHHTTATSTYQKRGGVLHSKRIKIEVNKRIAIAERQLAKKKLAKDDTNPKVKRLYKPKKGLDVWGRIKTEPIHALPGEVFAGNPHGDTVNHLINAGYRIAQNGKVFLLFLKK